MPASRSLADQPAFQGIEIRHGPGGESSGFSIRPGCADRYQSSGARLAVHSDGSEELVVLLDGDRGRAGGNHSEFDDTL